MWKHISTCDEEERKIESGDIITSNFYVCIQRSTKNQKKNNNNKKKTAVSKTFGQKQNIKKCKVQVLLPAIENVKKDINKTPSPQQRSRKWMLLHGGWHTEADRQTDRHTHVHTVGCRGR